MNSATSVTVKSSGKDLSRRKRKKDQSVDFEVSCTTVKPVLSGHSQNTKMGLQDQLWLIQVKSIAECSKGSILQYFRPAFSYHMALRPLFCLSLSGRLRQVSL